MRQGESTTHYEGVRCQRAADAIRAAAPSPKRVRSRTDFRVKGRTACRSFVVVRIGLSGLVGRAQALARREEVFLDRRSVDRRALPRDELLFSTELAGDPFGELA